MNNIKKTIDYLHKLFDESEYLSKHPKKKEYRLNHSLRVAAIGKQIAKEENVSEDALVIGCLLHDVSYIYNMKNKQERLNHGRKSVEICYDFVMDLDLEHHLKIELLHGIASHVDGKSSIDCEDTTLSKLISDCDNIDRFANYRLYEGLLHSDLEKMTLEDQLISIDKKINRLTELKNYPFSTNTSTRLWRSNVEMQLQFYSGLKTQLLSGTIEVLLR